MALPNGHVMSQCFYYSPRGPFVQRPGVRRAHQRLHGGEPFQLAAAKLQRQPLTPEKGLMVSRGDVGVWQQDVSFQRTAEIQSGVNIPQIVVNKKLHALRFPKSRLKLLVGNNLLLNMAGLRSYRSNH